MDIKIAIDKIKKTLVKLDNASGEVVFDEWVLVFHVAKGWKLLEYGGTREDQFVETFTEDLSALRDTFDPSASQAGEFAFSHEGYGTGFDVHICLGTQLFLFLNNTEKSTGDITGNPRWRHAQVYFNELVESFINNPVEFVD